ncbi:MAG: hypothetical protein HRT54_24025 [Colwellia sp.]|nr:hypothetical protein [Colwellia sp.]
MAVVTYNQNCKQVTNTLENKRKIDHWNLKQFSGLELGLQSGLSWLEQELSNENT